MKRSFLLLLASIGLLVSCGSESSPTQSGDSSSSQAGGSSSSTLVSGTSSGSSTTEGAFSALAIKDSAGSYWISGTASSPDGFSSIVGEVQHGGKVLDAKYFSVKVGTKLSDYARFGYDSKNVPLSGPKSIEMKLHEGDALSLIHI